MGPALQKYALTTNIILQKRYVYTLGFLFSFEVVAEDENASQLSFTVIHFTQNNRDTWQPC